VVFRLALRQTEGLIGSVIRLLDLDLPVPDHTLLSGRADGLDVPHRQSRAGASGMHLIVDSRGLKFHGPGERQVEKHGAKTRRLHRSRATALMTQRMSMPRSPRIMPVPPLSCRRAPLRLRVKLPRPIQTPRPSSRCIAERGRIGWQKTFGYNKRSRAEATIGRFKQVIGNELRSQTDTRQDAEAAVAIHVLNRMLAFGRPQSVRIS